MFTINNHLIRGKYLSNIPVNPQLNYYAKKLRKANNLSEVLFWQQLNKKKFFGINFNRQKIIGNYIVDFYVPSLGLVIEIDGNSHNNKEKYDKYREEYFISLGMNVYRIEDSSIKYDLVLVMENLRDFIIEKYKV
jgi:very-short-patch-repair endonuclease